MVSVSAPKITRQKNQARNKKAATGFEPVKGLAFPVDFTVETDLNHQNKQRFILDLVDDAIVADSKAVEVFVSSQLLNTARAWVLRERTNSRVYAFLERKGKRSQFFPSRVFDENLIGHIRRALILVGPVRKR